MQRLVKALHTKQFENTQTFLCKELLKNFEAILKLVSNSNCNLEKTI